MFKTLKKLKGSFALGIIFNNFSNIIIGARRGSPLAVGYSKEENYIGSDSYALKSMTNKISYLDDGELCVLTKDEVSFYDKSLRKINKKIQFFDAKFVISILNYFPLMFLNVCVKIIMGVKKFFH